MEFLSSQIVLSIFANIRIKELNIFCDESNHYYLKNSEVKLIRASFTNDKNKNVKTTEWVIIDPEKNEMTVPIHYYISDRKCMDLVDTPINVGDIFCISRVIEGEENQRYWAELVLDDKKGISIKKISQKDFEEILEEKNAGKNINIIY